MASLTRAAVSRLTGRVLLTTCETVVNETLARLATSLIVTIAAAPPSLVTF